jgi:hypothetical protein
VLSACSHFLVLDHGKVSAAEPSRDILSTLFGTAEVHAVKAAEA